MQAPSACIERRALIGLQARMLRARHRAARLAGDYCGRAAALLLLTLTAPAAAMALLFGACLRRREETDWLGRSYTEYILAGRDGRPLGLIGELPRLLCILQGRRAWVGPMARRQEELDLRQEEHRRIASSLPGLVSPWWVRQRTNIAYGDQTSADLEFIESYSARSAAGVLARAGLASLYGAPAEACPGVANILGLPVDNLSMDEAIAAALAPRPDELPRQVSFLNVDCVNKAVTDGEYRDILATSDLRLGDGIGLRIAGRLLQSEIRENVNGTDLFPRLCARLEELGLSLYLLGGRPGVAERVAEWAVTRHPELRVAGVRHGYFAEAETGQVLKEINESGAAVLLVAFGAPRQEKWIRTHRSELRVTAALGVGGLFDFYSGRIPRAPQWLREIGLEWTYRLCQEPSRMWRRYLVGNVVFLARVIRERLVRGPAAQLPAIEENL